MQEEYMDAEAIWGTICKSLITHACSYYYAHKMTISFTIVEIIPFLMYTKAKLLRWLKIHQFWTSTKVLVGSFHKTPMVSCRKNVKQTSKRFSLWLCVEIITWFMEKKITIKLSIMYHIIDQNVTYSHCMLYKMITIQATRYQIWCTN